MPTECNFVALQARAKLNRRAGHIFIFRSCNAEKLKKQGVARNFMQHLFIEACMQFQNATSYRIG